ncbi:hypothetical protein ACHAPT_002304 [Fusarium lateritium]
MSFVIYKHYDYSQQESVMKEAVEANKALEKPKTDDQMIVLVSKEMVEAMKAFFAQTPSCIDVPKLAEMDTMRPPYTWWFHRRKSHDIQSLPYRQARLVMTLVDWIEASYALLFDAIDDQLRRGRVSRLSMPFLLRPGDVCLSNKDGVPRGHVALAYPQTDRVNGEDTRDQQNTSKKPAQWRVPCQSLEHSGAFYQVNKVVKIVLETEAPDDEVNIASLSVMPLKYATDGAQETLTRRAKTWRKLRSKQLVSYEGVPSNET